MPGVQRIISNKDNLLRDADIAALNVREAQGTVFTTTVTRDGGGTIALTGSYTGASDTDIDVEIVTGDSGSTPRLSAPAFNGAGGSGISDLSATPGTPAQTLTVSLGDLGTETTNASASFQGETVQAIASGPGGNDISIEVDASGLVFTPTSYSLLEEVQQGVDEYVGPQWDFGGLPLDAEGNIPADAPWLSFGNDPAVYRQYKYFDSRQWVYVFSPAPERDAPARTRVNAVTGGVDVTVTDGITPETYFSIASLYDFLSMLTASSLVEATGPVVADHSPGGMASTAFNLRTAAYALTATPGGGDYLSSIDLGTIAIDSDAPTETITLRCQSNQIPGAESWTVEGTVSGDNLKNAVTATAYADADAPLSFTIPARSANSSQQPTGRIGIKEIQWASRDGSAPDDNAICLRLAQLGIAAENETFTLEYRRIPTNDCNCEDAVITGGPTEDCLGTEVQITMSTDPDFLSRMQALFLWKRDFVAGNTALESGLFRTAVQDVDLADRIANIFMGPLNEGSYSDAAANTAWDAALSAMQTDVGGLATMQPYPSVLPTWIPGLVVDSSDIGTSYQPPLGQYNGHKYELVSIIPDTDTVPETYTTWGISRPPDQPFSPLWPTDGTSVTDYYPNVHWSDLAGELVYPPGRDGRAELIDIGLISTEDIGQATSVSDIFSRSVEDFMSRYKASMDHVRALAGIVPPKDSARSIQDSCRRTDDMATYWWVDTNGQYLPWYTNHFSTSHIEVADPDDPGEFIPSNAQKFGFAVGVACPSLLREGDKIVVEISSVINNTPRYQIGDQWRIPIVSSVPLQFAGGQTGDDTHTWNVTSSTTGAMPDYEVDTASPAPYSEGGITFTITPGTIPDELGDTWTFDVEVGTARWRQDAGAWSAPFDIDDSVALGSTGLSAEFSSGSAPSWVADDLHMFHVKQPFSPANLRQPNDAVAQWSGSAETYTADLGGAQSISSLVIGRHTLPAGCGIELGLGNTAAATDWTLAVTWRERVIVELFDEQSYRYVRLSVTNADGATIGWWHLGTPIDFTYSAETCRLTNDYSMIGSGDGLFGQQFYVGQGYGGEIAWTAGGNWRHLTQNDLDKLVLVIDHAKQNNNEPLVLVPHHLHIEDARIVYLDLNRLQINDYFEMQPNEESQRIIAATIPLRALIE